MAANNFISSVLINLLLSSNLFFILVQCGEEPFQCRELYEFKETSGDIYSPFYGNGSYPLGLWCEYRIIAPDGYRIKLTFEDMDIYPYDFCREAGLSIYAWNIETGNRLIRTCGKDKPPPIITAPGVNVIHILLTTESVGYGRGFHLHYEASPTIDYCDEGLTQCHNRKCYDASTQKCNGVDDCGDGTDEEQCNLPLPTIACGKPSIEADTIYRDKERIIGGQEVVPNSWPWQVSMQNKHVQGNAHMCGGTLINAQWILTAAHCFKGMTNVLNWRIHFGKHHKYFSDNTEQIRYAERIIIWPNMTGETLKPSGGFNLFHDIGLVKLSAPVQFTEAIRPACLPAMGFDLAADTKCYVTGWGQTRGTGSNDVLKQTHVSIISRYDCGYDERSQICVKNKEEKSSTCHGDSGGPLSCKLEDAWHVMGATSYGTLTNMQTGICAMEEQETIFMKVSEKVEWIERMINLYS